MRFRIQVQHSEFRVPGFGFRVDKLMFNVLRSVWGLGVQGAKEQGAVFGA